jgi:hypothetical protein
MDSIELRGLTFRVDLTQDCDADAPWDGEDGHGPVRHTRGTGAYLTDKRPGERPLLKDRNGAWLYDWQAAMQLAAKDGWGLSPDQLKAWESNIGRAPTPGEVRLAAVQQDFDRLRRYLEGDWSYVGVVVTLLDTDGGSTHLTSSLWGVESDCTDYINETARELANELAREVGRRKFIETRTRVRA